MSVTSIDERAAVSAAVQHPLAEFYAHFSRNRGAVIGLVVVISLIIIAFAANIIAPIRRSRPIPLSS